MHSKRDYVSICLWKYEISIELMCCLCSYMMDEPSSYLDVKQRLKAAETIRELIKNKSDKYVLVVEHDLSVLDYLSDYICCLYGIPGCYGVVTMPFGVREGKLSLSPVRHIGSCKTFLQASTFSSRDSSRPKTCAIVSDVRAAERRGSQAVGPLPISGDEEALQQVRTER